MSSLGLAGGRISFEPKEDGYELRMQVALDRMIGTVVPELTRLQDEVGSQTGTADRWQMNVEGLSDVRAA